MQDPGTAPDNKGEQMARIEFDKLMSPEEFDRRGEERREQRDKDDFWNVVSMLIVAAFTFLVILWIVWGVMA